jgi:hypothetical protein
MMAKMGALPANGLPPVAVATPNFALIDLGSKIGEGVLIEGEGDHAFASFRPYVVEFEDHYIRFPAADARCLPEVIQEVAEVPSLNGPVDGHTCLKIYAPGSARTQEGAATMAVRTDDLTARHLGLDPRKRIALVHQAGDAGRLLCNMVELQDECLGKPAVGAARRGEQAEDVFPCLRPSAFARRPGLPAVQLSAFAHVFGSAPLARGLALVEIGQRQPFFATPAAPHLGRPGFGRRLRLGGRERRIDAPSPDARRAKRDSKLARDRAHRPSLRAKSSGLSLLVRLPDCHTNICSVKGRT